MAGLYISLGKKVTGEHGRGVNELLRIKKGTCVGGEYADTSLKITKFDRANSEETLVLSDNGIFLCAAGTIIYKGLLGQKGLAALRDDLLKGSKIASLHSRLDGHFIIALYYVKEKKLKIISDHAGIINLYKYEKDDELIFSTSSMVLSRYNPTTISNSAVSQFLRTGTICDSATIYNEIRVFEPATISTYLLNEDIVHVDDLRYWKSPIDTIDDLSFDEAVSLFSEKLMSVGQLFRKNKAINDFTGGFDSRMVLASLWSNHPEDQKALSTFVFGPPDSREVALVKQVCRNLNLQNIHVALPETWEDDFQNYQDTSLNISDGEENICNYAQILFANSCKVENGYQYSLNGLGGELYRDFWSVQEILYDKRPANIKRLVDLRVFQYEFENSIYSDSWQQRMLSVDEMITGKYQGSIADMDLKNSYNTLQIDNIYLRQKIRRWAGRTISSSNNIIGVVAPLVFKECLDLGMALPPKYKRNGKFDKKVIAHISKELAGQKMLNGTPCEPISLDNFYKFSPIISEFAKKGLKKISQKLLHKTILTDQSLFFNKRKWYEKMYGEKGAITFGYDNLYYKELYDKERFDGFVNNSLRPDFPFYSQLENIISFEKRLAYDQQSALDD